MTRFLERTADLFALIGGAVVICIVLVTSFNAGAFIMDRVAGLFGADVAGLPGYEELVRLGISMAALMFFPYCQLRRGHVAVTLFVQYLPRRVQILL
ncbi:MAG: TRAP transporter small permease subunit, partial [Mangrovicoccus sp.]